MTALLASILPVMPVTRALTPMSPDQMKGALFLDPLSVPCPGEVFAALNKVSRPNWANLVTSASAPVTDDRAQLALAVGVLAADGYVAVEARNGQQVKNIGREIMSLAKALAVSKSLMARGNSLIEFADNSAWDALADELEATENEVKDTMVDQKDQNLVSLTSAAAWLRGLEVATGVVLADESLRGAGLLSQPDLARHLASQIEGLPGRMKRGVLVPAVRDSLLRSATLLENTSLPPEKLRENLRSVHDSSLSVVRLILKSPSAQGTQEGRQPSPAPSARPLPSKS